MTMGGGNARRAAVILFLALVAIPGASAGLYVVDVDLPQQSPVHNVVVTYNLPAGVIYKIGSFSASGAPISSHQEVVSTPNDGSAPVTVTWTIESVYNTGNQDIEIQFDGIVADVAGNQDGVQLPPGTVSYTYDGGPGAKTGRSQPTEIVEPDLKIEKRRIGKTGNQIDYELSVYHTLESHSDAFDVVITDVVPQTNRYKPNSIIIFSGPTDPLGNPLGIADDTAVPVLTWSFDKIDTTWKDDNKVRLRYSIFDNQQGSPSPTTRTLDWTSAEGDGYGQDRHYSLGYDEEFLMVSISCDAESVSVGKVITYTYTVTNVAFGTTITGITLVDNRLGPVTLSTTSLGFGGSATGTKSYTVQESDYPGPLVNTATATGTYSGTIVTAVGTISVPFGIDPIDVTKTALNKTVARGESVTYIIEICNKYGTNEPGAPAYEVVAEDIFSHEVEFVSADPPPARDYSDGERFRKIAWTLGTIDDKCEKITLVVKVPERQDFEFSSESGVTGEGFVNAANHYTTSLDPFPLTNCIYVTYLNGTSNKYETISDCETVAVGRAGTELSTREHGSGAYESDDLVKMETENDLISLEKDMAATYGATTLTLPRNRTVTYSSRWTGEASAKNRVTGASMAESYRYATTLDRESEFFLNENESEMAISAEFDGTAQIGFLKMPTNTSTFKATPIFESREDYAGSFRIIERVDEYGSAAASNKSAEGSGIVVVDKRIGDAQRSYESGTGSYSSEELVRTYTNYIAKDIRLKYSPTGLRLTDGASANASGKWKEGISSATPGTSLIAEEYSSITELDKETVARGLNEMDTEANFSGRARYRTIYYGASPAGLDNTSTNESENASTNSSVKSRLVPTIDFDEIYEGDYSIARRILISGASRYDRPHLNVTKGLEGIEEETLPWGSDEPHLPGETKTRKIAAYAIGIENDGNRALGPIRVQDLFPKGAGYLRSSLRPTEMTAESCNWTLTHLAIGDVAEIEIELDVTGCPGPELTNRVFVCAGEGDEEICAANFSSLEIGWLSWPSDEISGAKAGELDEAEGGREDCGGWSLPSWDFERLGSGADLACEPASAEDDLGLCS